MAKKKRITTSHKIEGNPISYEILADGYNIYLGDNLWITQPEPYIPNKELSYEENAIAQIEDIVKGFEESANVEEQEEVTTE